ncbi:hypothetical protein N7539_004021 [Penicillium diatomitis]|uniref:Uncharacterized protein n=1 Tax=Penicillium diatomitis TaxID=2819901 RepID=A0A9X0BXT3_9EURO|nr:uncharacterized protein N7539_004021 [Penicillium diatomitis]KAJ5489131.1 hypothetical protein N7539_004021 [Penicillium diatomitis]
MLPVRAPQSPQHQRTRPGWNFEIYSDPEEFTFPAGWPSSEEMNSEYRSAEDNKENRLFLAAATEARQPRRPPRQLDQSAVALGPRDAFGSPFLTRHSHHDDEAGN